MNTSWKGISILIVLVVALYFDMPTFSAFAPQPEGAEQLKMNAAMTNIKDQYNQLKPLELALADAKSNLITIATTEKTTFPANNQSIIDIIQDDFEIVDDAMGYGLKLKAGSQEKVFVSEVASRLNNLFTAVSKIESIEMGDTESILIKVAKGKRLPTKVEPMNHFLGAELEASYYEEHDHYVLRTKSPENVVSLGLDLQGGMYLDVGVEVDKVLDAVTVRTADELENVLIDQNINYESVLSLGNYKIELLLELDEEINLADENYSRLLDRNFDVKQIDRGYIFALKAEEVDRIKEKSIEQALETIRNRIDQLGVKEPSIQRRGSDSIIIQLPGLKDPDRARRVIGQVAVLDFQMVSDSGSPDAPGRNQMVAYEETRDPLTKEVIQTTPYLLDKEILLKGSAIRDARVGFGQTGQAYVTMSFDDAGKDIFADVTGKFVGRRLAIILDGKVQSAPRINERIGGGEAQITGSFSPEEASELALVLRSGALPAPIEIHEERTVGASLGEDSIRQALFSLAIGFAGVVLFMMVYYNVSGLFSVLALVFNILLIVAALAYFQATLTLPGMAGIVLTIGMAVDANVLIFERIREELALGNGPRKAVQTGFAKATTTILDSNVTTILAAIVLFQFGTGPIKGFAVTLSIGIAASMFTAIVVGRFLFEMVYLRKQRLDKISI